jgi:predicted ArsR family transcriptional regulator
LRDSTWWTAQRNSLRITAPHSGGPTSAAAAKAIEPHAGTLRATILDLLRRDGPLTAQEIEDRTGLEGNTVRPRLCELRDAGKVRDSGLTRKTRSGRDAAVWEGI